MDEIKQTLFSTAILQVFDVLAQSREEISDQHLGSRIPGTKRSAVNVALNTLSELDLNQRVLQKKQAFNKANTKIVWIKYFKILSNLLDVHELVSLLQDNATKVILFGSRADGSNTLESDYDLLVVSGKEKKVRTLLKEHQLYEKLQLIFMSELQMLELDKKNPALYAAVKKGIVLWET